MILLFVAFAWLVVLSIVVGLCVAARIGDQAQVPSAWDSSEQRPQIYAPASLRTADQHDSLLDRDGVAA